MTRCDEITPAIGMSIDHDEIILVVVEDPRAALEHIDNDEHVTKLDWGTENNGDLDVWGKRLGGEFRIRIRGEKSPPNSPQKPLTANPTT